MQFVPEASLIALREGLEALLITGILLGLVTKLGRPDARKHVWIGFATATIASVLLGFLVQRYLLAYFEEQGGGEWFELVAALSAVAVLTYMIVWMWKHTRRLMTTVRDQVASLLTRGALVSIVFLTFASVIREGLEVVLFYGALAQRNAPVDLAWSGLVGLLASALIVLAILGGTAKVDLQKFFGITGLLLVFVAAGLLVHSVYAATDLAIIRPAPSIWSTESYLSEDGAMGRVLHALVGYASAPTLVQALLYFGYVFGVGGWYLWSLGAFTRRTQTGHVNRRAPLASAIVALLLVTSAVAWGAANPGAIVAGHGHDENGDIAPLSIGDSEKFGVLLRSHGEPVHYNETTYQSFADFVEELLVILGFEKLLLVDQGTVLLDKAHPFDKGLRLDADLMDAWTHDHPGPALYVGTPFPQLKESEVPLLDGYYVAPGGPGLGEPDILEMSGLGAYVEWLQMANESPMHHSKLRTLQAAEQLLKERYGDQVVVQYSYHVLPHMGQGETDAEAAAAFKAAGVTRVVDAYTTSVFSDVMNTCMMMPHMEHAFEQAGYTGALVHSTPAGLDHAYWHAVATHAKTLLAEYPEGARVALFLTHHGSSPDATNPCGTGPDQYNENARKLYEGVRKALDEEGLPAQVKVYQVYGQGAGAPDDGILSPKEALAQAKKDGALHVLDLPCELTGDGFDNLVAQRASYGLDPKQAPHYDANYETRLTFQGLDVRIASSTFDAQGHGLALVNVIEDALREDSGATHHDEHTR